MVNQVVILEGTYAVDAVEETLDTISPASGETIESIAYYTDADANTEYSLLLEETTLIDRLPGGDAPTQAEPHRLDLQLEEGDTLRFAATDLNSTAVEVRLVLLVENTNLDL